MAYRVRVSLSAKTDADEAYSWMKEHHSEVQAVRWFNGLVDAVNSLDQFPRRCPLAPESDELGLELRQHLYGKRTATYRIVFAVNQDVDSPDEIVQVYCIWHGSRDRIKLSDLNRD